jgi:hypothetical protein
VVAVAVVGRVIVASTGLLSGVTGSSSSQGRWRYRVGVGVVRRGGAGRCAAAYQGLAGKFVTGLWFSRLA